MKNQKIINAFEAVRNAVFPERITCEICHKELFEGGSFCPECERKMPYNDGYVCKKCGRALKEDYPVCVECKRSLPEYTAARSAFSYEGDVVLLIRKFKTGAKYLARPFADLLAEAFFKHYGFADIILSVPMTKRALKRRGYNQSELLAKELSARLSVAYNGEMLVKTRDTEAQKFLTVRERAKNLAGSFRVCDRKGCKGKTVLIVDDVLTTGATANAIAKALFSAHASRVLVLTVASVPLKPN